MLGQSATCEVSRGFRIGWSSDLTSKGTFVPTLLDHLWCICLLRFCDMLKETEKILGAIDAPRQTCPSSVLWFPSPELNGAS